MNTLQIQMRKLLVHTLGRLSDGIRIAREHGMISGKMIDYVYRNEPSGRLWIGKLLDRAYLSNEGWRAVRVRKGHLAAIQSCLDQTYPNWELIIVDDASTDDTPVRIAQYVAGDSHLRSVRHETNRRLPAALNTGFSQAKGDYLTWTSDDNCYRPNALTEMVAFLESEPEVDIVYTDYTEIDEKEWMKAFG